TTTRLDLPKPCGSTTVPRTNWSALRGSTPRVIPSSTVSSNLANATFFVSSTASSIEYTRLLSTCADAARYFFPDMFFSQVPNVAGFATPLLPINQLPSEINRRNPRGVTTGARDRWVHAD